MFANKKRKPATRQVRFPGILQAALNGDDFVKSSIGGIDVGIGGTEDGCYYAEFLYKGVGFCIITQGLSQAELNSVLESIIG